MNMMSLLTSFLQMAKIPNGMRDPDQITEYLLKNGTITQEQYNQARAKYQQMERNNSVPPCPY